MDIAVLRMPLDGAVERREALLADLAVTGALDVALGSRAELLGRELLGTPAEAVRDVAPST